MGAETVTARDANHNFSRLLREVEAGKEFIVTRGGVPVARILPEARPAQLGRRVLTPEQRQALEESLAVSWPLGVGKIDRDELYERWDRPPRE